MGKHIGLGIDTEKHIYCIKERNFNDFLKNSHLEQQYNALE